jgi:hypothetical protein
VARLVHHLGGSIIAARHGDCIGLAFDVSFGTGDEALCATAPALSVARLHLEEILPAVAEDASELLRMRHRASPCKGRRIYRRRLRRIKSFFLPRT